MAIFSNKSSTILFILISFLIKLNGEIYIRNFEISEQKEFKASPMNGEKCSPGYYKYPECIKADCDVIGTTELIADPDDGTCVCKTGYFGKRCDECHFFYYGYPNCQPCNCAEIGSLHGMCSNETGKCVCLLTHDGRTCDKCKLDTYNDTQLNRCRPCGCDTHGSLGSACNSQGKCACEEKFEGDKCDRCKKSHYLYPICKQYI